MKILTYISLLLITFSLNASAQQPFNMTEESHYFMVEQNEGFSIGNACDEPYMMVEIHSNLDMNSNPLEVMRSHIKVFGEVFNEGTIIYRCDDSILEVLGQTLSTTTNDFTSLKIYPIPATSEINITGINVTDLKLYDIHGRLLKHFQTFGQLHKILINDLADGLYFLVVNDTLTKKIIKV